METKNILLSKTFWANVVAVAATVAGVLPPKYAAIAVPVANIALRMVTEQPVSIS